MTELIANIILIILSVLAIGMWSMCLFACHKERKQRRVWPGWLAKHGYKICNNKLIQVLSTEELNEAAGNHIKDNPSVKVMDRTGRDGFIA